MAETESSHPLMMMSSRFVRQVREGYDAGIRYCFILGAGASVSSGIPLGTTLIRQWREYLLEQERRTPGFIRDCASEYVDWNYEEDVKPLFSKEYEVKSEDYFKFYDLRFAGMPVQAYSFLQGLMERARASYGYHALAILLNETKNRLVITTNFDSLVEDTLSLYNAKHPLVVGHESLAPFMESVENKGRTIIAKVHRDLLLHPQNRKEEMDKLDERWERALKNALSGVTPIVIGYAGGDHTLMSLLTKMDLGTIYWCTLDESEENVDDRILKLLRKQKNGRLVPIKGFDEIMYELFSSFSNIAGFKDSDKWMGTRVNESIKYHN
ncbi:MAG: SIR2 family protein, partial [Coriobacteriales bacterium]|nr:SIR2 family protein [Coriobacteriales bacterium]